MNRTLKNVVLTSGVLALGIGSSLISPNTDKKGVVPNTQIHTGKISYGEKVNIPAPEIGQGYHISLHLMHRERFEGYDWNSFSADILTQNNDILGQFGSTYLRSDDAFTYESQGITVHTSFKNENNLEYIVKTKRE